MNNSMKSLEGGGETWIKQLTLGEVSFTFLWLFLRVSEAVVAA